VSRRVERGCPQGSSLGPTLWLVCMNEWLEGTGREDPRGGVYRQTFADDQVILGAGMSVKEIERKWMDTWEICKEWERRAKMV